LLGAPIKGTVDVTDKDLTIDVDLGLLEKLFPVKQATAAIESRVRGLLK
jgi:autotransporter translocation and assembly factor TamB